MRRMTGGGVEWTRGGWGRAERGEADDRGGGVDEAIGADNEGGWDGRGGVGAEQRGVRRMIRGVGWMRQLRRMKGMRRTMGGADEGVGVEQGGMSDELEGGGADDREGGVDRVDMADNGGGADGGCRGLGWSTEGWGR